MKPNLTQKHVMKVDLEEVFGKVTKFKAKNCNLHLGTKCELVSLYTQIYGTSHVINNEFISWVVKEYIT
jgi:hypothetical protein